MRFKGTIALQIYHRKVFLGGEPRRGVSVELRVDGEKNREGIGRWRIHHVGRVGGCVLQGHVLSLGAEVFVCRAETYRFLLHVSAFI